MKAALQARGFLTTPSITDAHKSTVFTGNMQAAVHRWFRYSAGYSASWCEETIRKAVAEAGAVRVLDPFVGSGTTLLAAQAARVPSIGLERQPFVARVARAKLGWTADPGELLRRAGDVLRADRAPVDEEEPALLVKCFTPESLGTLRGLQLSIPADETGDPIDALLWLALVAVLRKCSHVGTAQWQYVLPNKRKARVMDPRDAFRLQVEAMAEDMASLQALVPVESATLLEEDARVCASVPDDWATLVVTSPPYANNFDYADATRLEMTFLREVRTWKDLKPVRDRLIHSCSQSMTGYDLEAELGKPALDPLRPQIEGVVARLSEERSEHTGKKAYDEMIVAYFSDLALTWCALRRACAPGAKVCFVVGDSAPYGVHVPVDQWLGDLAVAAGFESYTFEKTRDRNIKWQNRKHRVPLHEGRLWVDG